MQNRQLCTLLTQIIAIPVCRREMWPAKPSACGVESPSLRFPAEEGGSSAQMRVGWDIGEIWPGRWAGFAAAPGAERYCWGTTEPGNTAAMPVISRIALVLRRKKRKIIYERYA